MAITRLEYITVAELNEILNASFVDDTTTEQLIIEASELIEYATVKRSNHVFENNTDYRLNNLKLATAYQVAYNDDHFNIDTNYEENGTSFSLGRYSKNQGGTGSADVKEWKKIAPKTNRYLFLGGMLYAGADSGTGCVRVC